MNVKTNIKFNFSIRIFDKGIISLSMLNYAFAFSFYSKSVLFQLVIFKKLFLLLHKNETLTIILVIL